TESLSIRRHLDYREILPDAGDFLHEILQPRAIGGDDNMMTGQSTGSLRLQKGRPVIAIRRADMGAQVPAAQLARIDFDARLERQRAAEGLVAGSGFLVTDPTNVRYLTGFSGSAGMVLVLADEAVLLTDGRYAERATEELATNRVGVSLQVGRWPDV